MEKDITWNTSSLNHLDSYTKQCKLNVQKIIHLQRMANQLSNTFIDLKKVTKYILTINIPIQIDFPIRQTTIL